MQTLDTFLLIDQIFFITFMVGGSILRKSCNQVFFQCDKVISELNEPCCVGGWDDVILSTICSTFSCGMDRATLTFARSCILFQFFSLLFLFCLFFLVSMYALTKTIRNHPLAGRFPAIMLDGARKYQLIEHHEIHHCKWRGTDSNAPWGIYSFLTFKSVYFSSTYLFFLSDDQVFSHDLLSVRCIDLLKCRTDENRLEHHTDHYRSDNLIVRRGQCFQIWIELSQAFNPRTDQLYLQLSLGQFYQQTPILMSFPQPI